MKKDSKERLKVNETLMSLLFRLDSIRGVDSGVRDCRKSVIKKAIALQEMVDSIVVSGNHFESGIDAVVDSDDTKISGQDNWQESEADSIQPIEEQAEVPDLEHSGSNSAYHCVDQVAEKHNVTEATHDSCEAEQTNSPSANECGEESVGTSQTESQSDSSALPQSLIEGGEEENINTTSVKQEDQEEVKFSGNLARGGEENNRSDQERLLGRMLEDNEKMMGLMAELFQRNEMQTRLLCSLSRRVERLERALTSGQKRKKKRNAIGSVDCLDSCQDTKKCGKRK
ncbi:hypothetical protein HS088_TW22G00328 [Tripterygium wilfordii]|uniref:BAG domain-containing protein n=1 Tax=Tripterygium wilfordii TaxID=458696 RepID=A0A7J7BYF1_TRIWF|nr:hypothetical protein HS088_TW22G00328 [Tripterygium wilfordii]